jgi:AraC-like DNA-binding protein
MERALVIGPGERRTAPFVHARVTTAFVASGGERDAEIVAAPDVAPELKLGVGPRWSSLWLAPPAAIGETHRLAAHTEVHGFRLVPGVWVSGRAIAAAEGTRAFRDFLRAPRTEDRSAEAMRVASHVLAVSRIDERVARAVELAAACAHTVEALAEAAGTTPRHLGRRFDAVLGIAPKRVTSILRLRRALALAATGAPWGLVAAEAGYADQSHLGRELRALLGPRRAAFALR